MARHFENDVITKWLTGSDEDRDVELTADFAFVEPTERWEAPAGSAVKGASIPSQFVVHYGKPFRRRLNDAIEKRFGPNL